MLVLTRKLSEAVLIGDRIRVVVLDIDRGKIRLGIEAPKDTVILRQELAGAGHPAAPKPGDAGRG